MSSTFGALNTSTSGLYAAQRGLDITGQNVANVNTDGYSRQRVDLQSVGASTVPASYAIGDGIGGGVDSSNVVRLRDAFLEARAQREHAASSQLTTEDDALTRIQQAFNEPNSGNGISAQLGDVWSAWQTLANDHGSADAGAALLQTTQTLVDGLNTARATLDTQWLSTRSNLSSIVDDVNSVTANIATMNKAIQRATQAGQPANELSDQRDALVLQLAQQTGATSQPNADGMVDVVIGGVSVVSGVSRTQLALVGATGPDDTAAGTPQVITATGRTTVSVGGTAGGDLNALTNLIPTYRSGLDQVTADLAARVNAQLAKGFDASGNPGGPMFGTNDGSGTVTAGNITLLISDPRKIGASSAGPDANGPTVDGGNADAVAQLGSGTDTPDAGYRAMIVQLGVQASSTSRNLGIQTTVTNTVDSDRESVSGVSIDEEMTNMMAYQHAYSASARMITAIDSMLDTVINHMGLVGNA